MSGSFFSVRAGEESDLRAVLGIERASAGAPQWSEAIWRGLLQPAAGSEPLRQVFVGENAERVVGILVVMLSGTVAEIESVAVDLAQRRRGIGGALCRHAMRWAAERGALLMELEVRSRAEGARALYGSLGFTEHGIRRGYYERPEDDAVLLHTVLDDVAGQRRKA